jgi:hypothetical protein
MRRYVLLSLIFTCMTITLLAPQVSRASRVIESKVRFAPVDIYLDSGSRPLAAYQFELKVTKGKVKIVGVEGGEHAAFQEAPYYDPAALMKDRIIIAAFNTGRNLPTGRTRIARVHLQITGAAKPQYELELAVAADAHGQETLAEITLQRGENK